jgi:hypothetical protein
MNTKRAWLLTWLSLAVAGFCAAQDQAPAAGGWRKVGEQPPSSTAQDSPRATMDPNYAPGQLPAPGPGPAQAGPNQGPPAEYNPGPIPPKLTIRQGTFVTVRLNQPLSSDRNQPGDGFAATLVKPLVVDGWVLADSGQTVGGRVVEATKAGRVKGVSRLGIQLTDLTLADGNPVPVQTQLVSRNGRTSEGRDVGAVATTTGLGAAIGAAADWGTGAAIGAGAGAAAGIIGVLLTRGHPTVLYPEQLLTFRIDAPVTVSTAAAPQAFHYIRPGEYQQAELQTRMGPRPYPRAYPPSYYAPYPYPYPYYWGSYYWGPRFGFYWGPRFYGHRFWGRGWRR